MIESVHTPQEAPRQPAAPEAGRAVRRAPSEPVPLSYVQQRLWFLDQVEGGRTEEYGIQETQRLRGTLDVPALERAINMVVARHEVLRTHFVERDGDPMQVVEAERTIPLPVIDLRHVDAGTQATQIREILWKERCEPFDLARGPVVRMKLVRVDANEYVFVRNFHHIAYDGWSRGILNREVGILYDAIRAGVESPLPPLKAQYADFAMWQRRPADSEQMNGRLAYWKQQLEGLPDRLELPADRPRRASHTELARVRRSIVSPERLTALKRVSREYRTTLYMTLLAGLVLLLRRYTNRDDVAVGSPITHRYDPRLEELIGCFVNMLVLRVRMRPAMRVRDVLAEVRRTTLDAFTHQEVPFERVVEAVAPQRSLDRMPLFQIQFALQNAPVVPPELSGVTMEPVLEDEARIGLDLELYISERGGQLELVWQYNSALFDPWRIDQMARHYERALDAIMADGELSIDRVAWLDPGDERQLLDEWNATAHVLPDATPASRFGATADEIPDAVAVMCGEEALTYRALDERSNRLAHLLIERGTRPEDLVAIAVPRSLDMIVALLGVLKTGAAYLPLDPDAPAARLDFMLQDAQPRCVVTNFDAIHRIPEIGESVVLGGLATESALARCATTAPHGPEPRPQQAAYIIYTSGSTGRSKGVVGTQGGLMNRLSWFAERHDFRRAGPVLGKSSFSFIDGSTELLGPLLHGGTIVLADADQSHSAVDLASLIARHGIGLITVVPSLLRTLMDEAPSQALETCRLWITSGEALPHALALAFGERWPAAALFNLYGASEATGDSLCCRSAGGDIAIGAPIWNTRVYVLDRALALTPIGVAGELYVAGAGLGRGYLGQPDLTAARFVPDPYGAPGARMYRTGDLARWRPDGNIEYLGRTDHQVKIRGCRVEPAELQAALIRLSGVSDAIVVAQPDARGEQCLIGYVVPESGRRLDPRATREALRHLVPDYLVPSAIVPLERVPLTSHGKLDRAALPAPELSTQETAAPSTPHEERVCGLVAEVLGIERVSTGDNFFDLGGHSLLAMRLANRLRTTFGVQLSVRALFEARTIAELAQSLIQ